MELGSVITTTGFNSFKHYTWSILCHQTKENLDHTAFKFELLIKDSDPNNFQYENNKKSRFCQYAQHVSCS